jgi:hypothetical protein
VQGKFAIVRGRNSSRAMESLCCDSGIIRFAENSIASCEQSGSHSGSDSKTNPHLHPLPLGKGEAKSNARSVCKVTSAYGIGKLHTELTRAFSAWLSVGNRIPGALPQVRHGEWSRRDASDIDGLSREAERSGSELSQSVLWRTGMRERLWR